MPFRIGTGFALLSGPECRWGSGRDTVGGSHLQHVLAPHLSVERAWLRMNLTARTAV